MGIAIQNVQPKSQIRLCAGGRSIKDVVLIEQSGQFASEGHTPKGYRFYHHMRQARMEGQLGHCSAVRGDMTILVEGSKG